jgi:hypothetical protein
VGLGIKNHCAGEGREQFTGLECKPARIIEPGYTGAETTVKLKCLHEYIGTFHDPREAHMYICTYVHMYTCTHVHIKERRESTVIDIEKTRSQK